MAGGGERYRELFRAAGDAMLVCAPEGRILEANRRAVELLACPEGELANSHLRALASPGEAAAADELLQRVRCEGAARARLRFRKSNGQLFPAEVASSLVRAGDHSLVLHVLRDVAEWERRAQQQRTALRMEAIGRLAAGVAHDFNSLLTIILGYSDVLLSSAETPASHRDLLEEIRKAAARAAEVTGELLAFSRQQVLQPRLINLNEVILAAAGAFDSPERGPIEVRLELDPHLGWVKVDPDQLRQAVLNLMENAGEAMPAGGALTVETANVEVTAEMSVERPEFAPGPYVMAAVTDTGKGMEPEALAQAFQPFFSTKGRGPGGGLGLSTAYGIVKQSDGFIYGESASGRGTTFRIYLPRWQGPANRRHRG